MCDYMILKYYLFSYRSLKSIQWKKKCVLWIVAPQILYLGKLNISKLSQREREIF
jgi:hypothetical protein